MISNVKPLSWSISEYSSFILCVIKRPRIAESGLTRERTTGLPHVYSTSGSPGSNTSLLCVVCIWSYCVSNAHTTESPEHYYREVADTKARCVHGASTVSRKILLLRGFGNSCCPNAFSTAAKGIPDRDSLQARARGLNRSMRCPSSSSMNCGDRTTGMIPSGGAMMSCVSWHS